MSRAAQQKRQHRRSTAGATLFAWLAGVHLLPLLHVVAHDFPHQHAGDAIVYLLDALNHQDQDLQTHRHGGIEHSHPETGPTAALSGEDAGPSAPEPDADRRSDEEQAPLQQTKSLAHGFVSILSPVAALVPIATLWVLQLQNPPPPRLIVFVASVTQRARDPPSA